MNILAIDSSSSALSVVLQVGERLLNREIAGPYSHHEELAPVVESCLDEAGIAASDLDTIVVGAGPGSFTGLRIGFGFAKGLAAGSSAELKGFSSLAAAAVIAAGSFPEAEYICTFQDARRGEYFGAVYSFASGQIVELKAPQIVDQQRLEEWKDSYSESAVVVVLEDDLALPWQGQNCRVEKLSEGLLSLSKAQNLALSLQDFEPLYVRKAAAKTLEERKLEGIDK